MYTGELDLLKSLKKTSKSVMLEYAGAPQYERGNFEVIHCWEAMRRARGQ